MFPRQVGRDPDPFRNRDVEDKIELVRIEGTMGIPAALLADPLLELEVRVAVDDDPIADFLAGGERGEGPQGGGVS